MIPNELDKQLRKWEQKSSKLSDLVEAVNRIVVDLPLEQPYDQRVSSELNERSLRYYISEGLLEAPDGKGSAAVYGKRHLLQILALKALQARYLPIKRIREILWGKSDEELERILRDYVREQSVSQKALPHRDYPSEQIPMFESRTPEEASWKRLTLEDGVELHIREDRMKALSRSEVKRIVETIRDLLKVKRG